MKPFVIVDEYTGELIASYEWEGGNENIELWYKYIIIDWKEEPFFTIVNWIVYCDLDKEG